MKTTVEIEDELLRQAKKEAIDRGCSLRDLVQAGLRGELERRGRGKRSIPRRWITAPGPIGVPAGVDLSNRATLSEWLAGERAHASRKR